MPHVEGGAVERNRERLRVSDQFHRADSKAGEPATVAPTTTVLPAMGPYVTSKVKFSSANPPIRSD